MAIIPFAEKRLITPGSSDPPIIPIGMIFHVDAGNASDLYDFFKNRSGGIESHGHIRKDGPLYQYRDTGYESDANYKANSFYKDGKRYGYLSFETQGFGSGFWTSEQIQTIKKLILWGNSEYGIPFRVCRNTTDPGIGYHTLFGAPSAWTPIAKSCPGPNRKQQFHKVIVPWMVQQTKPKEWDEMATKKEFVEAIEETVPSVPIEVRGKDNKLVTWPLQTVLRNIEADQDTTNAELKKLSESVNKLNQTLLEMKKANHESKA